MLSTSMTARKIVFVLPRNVKLSCQKVMPPPDSYSIQKNNLTVNCNSLALIKLFYRVRCYRWDRREKKKVRGEILPPVVVKAEEKGIPKAAREV